MATMMDIEAHALRGDALSILDARGPEAEQARVRIKTEFDRLCQVPTVEFSQQGWDDLCAVLAEIGIVADGEDQ